MKTVTGVLKRIKRIFRFIEEVDELHKILFFTFLYISF